MAWVSGLAAVEAPGASRGTATVRTAGPGLLPHKHARAGPEDVGELGKVAG